MLLQRATLAREIAESPTMEIRMKANTMTVPDRILDTVHEHLPYTGKQPGMRSHKLWGMRQTNLGLPNMDHMMMDATQAATEMAEYMQNAPTARTLTTNQGDGMMFHIDTGTPQDGDQDRLPWQKRPACNWDTGDWTGLAGSAGQMAPFRNLHSRDVTVG